MSSEKGPKSIYAQEHNNITIVTLECIKKIKIKKKAKQSEEYFFHLCCKKIVTSTEMAS